MSAELDGFNDRRFPQFSTKIGSPIARYAARQAASLTPPSSTDATAFVIKTEEGN